MKTHRTFLALLAIVSLPVLAHAAPYNRPVCVEPGAQSLSMAIPDGVGGTIVVWSDHRGPDADIYAQRMNAAGDMLWPLNGVPICTAVNDQTGPELVSDAAGGAIIVWNDMRAGEWFDVNWPSPDIYAQRIDANGNVLWATDGVAICTADYGQQGARITSDGAGGAFITWGDDRNGPEWQWPIPRLYMQHINASGQAQWTENGVSPCDGCDAWGNTAVVPDGSGGAIVTWSNLYAQRVDASGNPAWTASGVIVSSIGGAENQSVIPCGNGGAIIAWDASRTINGTSAYHIYAQCLDGSGTPLWTANGVPLCEAATGQFSPRIVSDGAGGAIVTWDDLRNVWFDIYAQRVDANGAMQWQTDGIPVCMAGGDQEAPDIASDNAGGAIISWQDYRTGQTSQYWDIYAQRVDGSGTAQWTPGGIPISTAPDAQRAPIVASDGNHGAFITWTDRRSGSDDDVYGQHVDGSGQLITAVGGSVPAAHVVVGESRPNPFSDGMAVDVTLNRAAAVSIDVFDVAGHRVRTLNAGRLDAGVTRLTFDGRDDHAHALPSGVYFYRVHAGADVVTKKMVIAR